MKIINTTNVYNFNFYKSIINSNNDYSIVYIFLLINYIIKILNSAYYIILCNIIYLLCILFYLELNCFMLKFFLIKFYFL